MPRIVTLTFSPCIDKSTSIPCLVPDKKLRCNALLLQPGGGGINVARAIHKLGGEATAIYPSGGYTGKFFNHLLEKENVPFICIETDHETRESITILDLSTNQQYKFGLPDNGLNDQEWGRCLKAVEDFSDVEFIVASGSLPHGVPLDIYARLSRIAKNKNAKLIVDTSGEALKHAVHEGVYLFKPNLGELSSLIGKERIESDEIEVVAREILNRGHAEIIVISMGRSGAMLFTKNDAYYTLAPNVTSKSTVGAGDSMVAGLVYSISRGWNLKQALQYGVACGTAATMNPGTELCHKEDADLLFSMITVMQ
ncbi:MAG: 1-phosphofructokinase family hexose kinase [Saprospiraceae bacterium]